MVILEELTGPPDFSCQLENKILYVAHQQDTSITYQSTYTLKYVLEGTKYYRFNNQQVAVGKHQYVILNNDQRICSEAEKGTRGVSFFLSSALMHETYAHYSSKNAPLEFFEFPQTKSNDVLGQWLHQIVSFYEQAPITFRHQMEDLFLKLSETIVQEQASIQGKFDQLKIVKQLTRKELYKLIVMTKEYLQDNSSHHISLDSIGKNIGVSKYYLHRLFTKVTGSTPLQYLTQIRLDKAKNKLKHSSDSIFDIAIACGFESLAYFSVVFKRHQGLLPSQYRKSARF